MRRPGLIQEYLAELSANLPAQIVEELADGLDQTRRHYLERGLDPDAAAETAIAEFGEPSVIAAAFTCASPARHAARTLLVIGPAAGACWGAALVTSRAWTWPVPPAARILFGVTLLTVIGLLAAAAFGRKYRSVSLSGTAGCAGIATLDSAMLAAVAVTAPAVPWPMFLAITVSAVRIAFTARILRPVLTH
jgi:hypothetical protein